MHLISTKEILIMGFKWFRARITMNRMPVHSSAVEGIYTPISQFDFDLQNTNGSGNSLRPLSMSILNNSTVGYTDGQTSRENKRLANRTKSTRELSKSVNDLVVQQEDFYVVNTGPQIDLPEESSESIYGQTIEMSAKKLIPKTRKAEFKRKKVRAPMPKLLEATNGNKPENGNTKYVAIEKAKMSDENEIDI